MQGCIFDLLGLQYSLDQQIVHIAHRVVVGESSRKNIAMSGGQ